MAVYAGLADCTDPVVTVEESDLEDADRYIRTLLRRIGVDPDAATPGADGLDLLRRLAVAHATMIAALRGAADGETVLWRKHESYRTQAAGLEKAVNAETLGLSAPGGGASGWGNVAVGRG